MSLGHPFWEREKLLDEFPDFNGGKLFPQSNITQEQYNALNNKLNKVLWKLTEIENTLQRGRLPVWYVQHYPLWVEYPNVSRAGG